MNGADSAQNLLICGSRPRASYLQQVALVRVSSEEQPVQGGGQTGTGQLVDALQPPRRAAAGPGAQVFAGPV